ncbi:hypothetical protein QTP88_024023 [Uroleucon formosanum]
MEFTTMFSQNGKLLTVLDNFKFKFKYESKISGYKTWECTNKSCKAKLVFNKEKTLIKEKSVLDHIHEADSTIERQAVIFMDGTFQFCTKFFYQFFVLHGFQNGIYTSLVYALLPNKRTSTYEHVFKKLRDACLTEGFVLNPNMFVIDFEIGIHEAVRSIWPTSIIRGCNFHLGQAWFRKLQNLGLSKLYIEGDTDEGTFLNYIFGFPFLEPHEVEDSFVFDLIADMPSNNQIVQFCDYLTETYKEDIFPPSLWASKSEVITNNVCESFHSKFNAYFYHHHPSLYKYIDALQDIQVDTYIKIKSK